MILFDEVSFSIGKTTILQNVSLEVREGETLVLLGRSGSGKTTALRMVNAMRIPTTGRVSVEGQLTSVWNEVSLRRKIGYVIQDVGLFPHRTVAENIGTVPRLLGWDRGRIAKRVDSLLDEVGLSPSIYRDRQPAKLSGGQRQRVGVARALAAEPRILLFDEPFGALDPITRREMQELFLALRERHGVTSVFVTHDVTEALQVGTQIGLLNEGSLEFLGSPEDFMRASSTEAQQFLGSLPPVLGDRNLCPKDPRV